MSLWLMFRVRVSIRVLVLFGVRAKEVASMAVVSGVHLQDFGQSDVGRMKERIFEVLNLLKVQWFPLVWIMLLIQLEVLNLLVLRRGGSLSTNDQVRCLEYKGFEWSPETKPGTEVDL